MRVWAWLGSKHALRWHRIRSGRSERIIVSVNKNLRRLLIGLSLVLAMAGLAVALAFTPMVQTMVAQSALRRQPGLRSSLESLSASFGKAELVDLRLQYDGAVLVIPSLSASLPVAPAVLRGDVRIGSLVAKGWTLDLSRRAQLSRVDVPAGAAPEVRELEGVLGELLGHRTLPAGVSIDAIDLDGTVLLPAGADLPPVRVHVVAKGGALAAGRSCTIELVAGAELKRTSLPLDAAEFRGDATAAFDAAGQLIRVGLKGDAQVEGRGLRLPSYSVEGATEAVADGISCQVAVSRSGRKVVDLSAMFPRKAATVRGTWRVDTSLADLAPFLGKRVVPAFAVAGAGTFTTDVGLAQLQASGDVTANVEGLGTLVPMLEPVGTLSLEGGFDLTYGSAAVQIDRLRVALSGGLRVASVRALQPFRIKTGSWSCEPTLPNADLVECSVEALPPDWLAGRFPGWSFEYAELASKFVVRAADGGVVLRSAEPAVAHGVTIRRSGAVLASNLDLMMAWQAEAGSKGWELRCSPLTICSAGRRLGSWDGSLAQPDNAGGALTVAGKWDADLDALAAVRGAVAPGFDARCASGEINASFGRSAVVTGSATFAGAGPAKTIAVSVQGRMDANGSGSFYGPIRLGGGDKPSELGVEVSLSGRPGTPASIELNAEQASLEQLQSIVAPAMAMRGWLVSWVGGSGSVDTGAACVAPFWGDWLGRVRFSITHLKLGARQVDNANGVVEIDHDGLRLRSGRGDLDAKRPVRLEGSISYSQAAAVPYRLIATGGTGRLEAVDLFPPLEQGADPVVSGRFELEATLSASGTGWDDLLAHMQQEYRLTSTTGIVRFLKTNLGGVNPEAESAVANALSGTVSGVGRLFSVDKRRTSGDRALSMRSQSVLNFSYDVAELGYSQARVTAIREPDGSWRLHDISMITPELVLSGTGRISAAPSLTLAEQPLETELQIGLRGALAARLAETGLLSTQKDAEGFTALCASVHFRGMLKRLDDRDWHDLLFNAARAPEPEKKDR